MTAADVLAGRARWAVEQGDAREGLAQEASGYERFLAGKRSLAASHGREVDGCVVNPLLFPFQRDVTLWAVRKGRCAVLLDTGLGKTFVQLEWARLLGERTLILAPLSVARQTVREARKIDLDVRYVRSQADVKGDGLIWISNYEMLDAFDPAAFGAVVLDESSCLKALDAKRRAKLTAMFANTPYRLCCSATPAPNDYVELGNHAHFLGIATTAEMLSMFFINANKQHTMFLEGGRAVERKGSNKGGQEWRLKHHAEGRFFEWLSSWAMTMSKPSDLGYDDGGFILPPLNISTVTVPSTYIPEGQLFFVNLRGIADRVRVRAETVDARLEALREIVERTPGQWIVWCGLDRESSAVAGVFSDSVEVRGQDTPDSKAQAFEDFQDGKYRILATKPRIGGFGLNMQCAHHMAFFGLSDSWEQWYQCIRREWRYGQAHPVDVHVIISELESAVYANVLRKDKMATRLRAGLVGAVKRYEMGELGMTKRLEQLYEKADKAGATWKLLLGDSCERLRELADTSCDLSVYSPPFADLFCYSASDRDLGNSRGWGQFFEHYSFIVTEMLRITKPGRLTCVHTSDIPAMASRDGWIGLKDFPGEMIRAYERGGWVFSGRAFVQKNPQAQAVRVKSKALLFVQLRKDSADSRPALIDQVLLFRKPGDNSIPVRPVANGELDNETWIEWAHGIWLGVSESDTLQYSRARASDDEKHICPLQLPVIERCVKLYSNPGELVLDPFAGIGSTGFVAVKNGRRFLGCELKPSYFDVAVGNLERAEHEARGDMFAGVVGV